MNGIRQRRHACHPYATVDAAGDDLVRIDSETGVGGIPRDRRAIDARKVARQLGARVEDQVSRRFGHDDQPVRHQG